MKLARRNLLFLWWLRSLLLLRRLFLLQRNLFLCVLSMESRRAQSKTAGCVLTYEAVLSQRSWISGSRFHLSILKPDKVDSSSYQAH